MVKAVGKNTRLTRIDAMGRNNLFGYECRLFLIEHDQMKPNQQPYICSKFGCRRELTITERLYSDFCFEHQPLEKLLI